MARRTKRWTVKRQRETHSKPADGKKYRTSLQALHYRNYSELGNASDARKFADGISDLLAAACDGEGGTPPLPQRKKMQSAYIEPKHQAANSEASKP